MTRKRKKWLKKHNQYINPRETWELDTRIAEFIVPRLKLYKELKDCYPGRGEMDTPEKWDNALDLMIAAFEIVIKQNNYDDRYWDKDYKVFYESSWEQDNIIKEHGLQLFIDWFQDLGW